MKIDRWFKYFLAIVVSAAALASPLQAIDRTSISLDLTWNIEDLKMPKPFRPHGTIWFLCQVWTTAVRSIIEDHNGLFTHHFQA